MRLFRSQAAAVFTLLLAPLCPAQTHSYGKAEIEEGARAYRVSCIGCHGGDGTSVNGVDLARGKMKRATSDEDLAKIIMNGIPNTGMPASPVSLSRAYMIVAYIRNMSAPSDTASQAAPSGDPARGRALFFGESQCHSCHRLGPDGGRSAPNLSDVGLLLRSIEIETALLNPDAASPLSGPPFSIALQDGSSFQGFLLNQDSATVQFLTRQGQLRSLLRQEIRSLEKTKSWMPSFRGKLNPQQIADLIAFLSTQKGVQ
jgi:putative heme-binding domain-containing protein